MNRQKINQDIEDTIGIVPTMFKSIPDSTIENEWDLFKKIELGETAIPNKYKELMGLAVASAMKCSYCIYFHTEAAKLFGATNEEIQEAVHISKHTMGWSTYVNGTQIDLEEFKNEVNKIGTYVKNEMEHHH